MNREAMQAYSAATPPIYVKYQGHYLGVGGVGRGVEHLVGDWPTQAVMLAQFPSPQAVSDFWWGPEYRAAAKLREGAVEVDVCRLEGTGAAPPESTATPAYLILAQRSGEVTLETALVERHGGVELVHGETARVETLEGDLSGVSVGLVAFPSGEALQAFWADPEAQGLVQKLSQSGELNAFRLAGQPKNG
jgi:uncharacterized protein (DUF1330 family)